MTRFVDTREREEEVLDLVVQSYITESKPVSSTHLCEKYHLPCSSATVRNVMEALEKKGFLSHLHTSSGRVPTQTGFKHYVEHLKEEEMFKNIPCELSLEAVAVSNAQEVISHTLDVLAQVSGYTSLMALSGRDEQFFFRGTRFILEQPEFEDIRRLKNLFYILEVKMDALQELLFTCLDEHVKILIGDEIGFDEISDCSLLVSGVREEETSFALAVLGPMRMNYIRAASSLYTIKNELRTMIEGFL